MSSSLAFLALTAASIAAPLPTEKRCVADRSKWDPVYAGLSWVCGAGVDCTPINKDGALFYPDNVYAHSDYAFDQYYQAHAEGGAASCAFNGAAYLVDCISQGVTCQAKKEATDAELAANIKYVCSSDNFADRCAPILPNGTHFQPNTTRDHANLVMDMYYQTYRCAQPDTACTFNGTAEILYTNETTALESAASVGYDIDAAMAWMQKQGCDNKTITNCPGNRLCTDAEFYARALAAGGLVKLNPNDLSQAPYANYTGLNLALTPGLISFLEKAGFKESAPTAFPKGAIAFTKAWAPGMPVFALGNGLCDSHTPIVAQGPHCAQRCDQFDARVVYTPPQ